MYTKSNDRHDLNEKLDIIMRKLDTMIKILLRISQDIKNLHNDLIRVNEESENTAKRKRLSKKENFIENETDFEKFILRVWNAKESNEEKLNRLREANIEIIKEEDVVVFIKDFKGKNVFVLPKLGEFYSSAGFHRYSRFFRYRGKSDIIEKVIRPAVVSNDLNTLIQIGELI